MIRLDLGGQSGALETQLCNAAERIGEAAGEARRAHSRFAGDHWRRPDLLWPLITRS